MIDRVIIIPAAGTALLLKCNSVYRMDLLKAPELTPFRRGEIGILLDSGVEMSMLRGTNFTLTEIENILKERSAAYQTLDFLVTALERSYSTDTRTQALRAASQLIESNPSIINFVKGRLFGRRVPEMADLDGAIALASDHAEPIQSLFAQLKHSKQIIARVRHIWESIVAEKIPIGWHDSAEELVLQKCVLANCVEALVDSDSTLLKILRGRAKELNYSVDPIPGFELALTVLTIRLSSLLVDGYTGISIRSRAAGRAIGDLVSCPHISAHTTIDQQLAAATFNIMEPFCKGIDIRINAEQIMYQDDYYPLSVFSAPWVRQKQDMHEQGVEYSIHIGSVALY